MRLKIKIARLIYNLLWCVLSPILGWWWWRDMSKYEVQKRFFERFGKLNRIGDTFDIWVHASSVGEVKACVAFVKQLQQSQKIILSTTTATGFGVAQSELPDVCHFFFGFDIPFVWRRVLQKIQVKKLVLLEREVWPNLISVCKAHQVSVYLVNAKLSKRSFKKTQKLSFLLAPTLIAIKQIYCQSESDYMHFLVLGVDRSSCQISGNLKFDVAMPKPKLITINQKPVWVAGSTQPDEERWLLNIHQRLLEIYPHALLILAPRRPERFEEVAQLIERYPLSFARLSKQKLPSKSNQVFLVDTLGKLFDFYACADWCFVGGSLFAGIGGHNLLEPAVLKKPILTGTHISEIKHMVALLGDSLSQFDSQEAGFSLMKQLAEEPHLRDRLGKNGFNALKRNKGATDICVRGVLAND